MDEQVFFDAGGYRVSSTRIDLDGQTFATRNVGGVRLDAPGVGRLPVMLAIVGAFVAVGADRATGLLLLGVALVWIWRASRIRQLRLMAGGGEVIALSTRDPQLAEQLRQAISSAIAVR